MTDNYCPQCGAISPGSKTVCECGYHFRPHFQSSVIEQVHRHERRSDPAPHTVAAPEPARRPIFAARPSDAQPPTFPGETLAARSVRFTATVIDALVVGAIAGIPYSLISVEEPLREDLALVVLWLLVAMMLFVQGLLLSRLGQSIGKAAMGIRIVDVKTGRNAGFMRNVLMRVVVNWMLCFIPLYVFVDLAMIFRDDRRCVHDLMAGTRVVDV